MFILHGLKLRGRVVVIPNCFLLVVLKQTVYYAIFISEEILWLDSYHDTTRIHWAPILSHMFVEAVWMPRCLILYTHGHGSNQNTWISMTCMSACFLSWHSVGKWWGHHSGEQVRMGDWEGLKVKLLNVSVPLLRKNNGGNNSAATAL